MKRYIPVIILLLVVAVNGYAEDSGSLTLDSLIKEALDNNPGIRAAYNRQKAAEYKISQAASLPDPMARYSYFGENV
ncbi:MAG: hypothetical protein HQ572_02230, partial [Candidatus Omnitrophica bacterium]|nr:hypothetical protein [Candidatus Omnitrophota bacterium]